MNRSGFALVFVLLVLAAIETLTLGSLALAMHESAVADARVRTIVATRHADAALASLIKSWPVPSVDSLRIGERSIFANGNDASVQVYRTAWGLYHATATGLSGRTATRRAAVLRTLDAVTGLAESSEAVVSAGIVVTAGAELGISTGHECVLPVAPERAPAVVTVTKRYDAVGITDPRADSAHANLPAGYALAGVRWDELASIADIQAAGAIQLVPTDSTGSATYPLVYADGDLTIMSGSGQGLIFVHGNLRIQSGVQFRGIVVVRETVVIDNDVDLVGTLRIQGEQMSNIARARITYSACAVLTALQETPAAARLIRATRTYIPDF